MELFTSLVTSVLLVLFFYYVLQLWSTYNYWKVRGVVGPTPIPILGNYAPVIFQQYTEGAHLRKFYEQYPNEKFIGIYKGVIPVLLIRDPDIVKEVLIKKIDQFHMRCQALIKNNFNKSIFAMDGNEKWQNLRNALSPAFTKFRLTKSMPVMENTLNKYLQFIDDLIEKNIEMEIRFLNTKYVLEMLGNLVLGVHLDTFSGNDEMEKLMSNTMDLTIDKDIFVYIPITGLLNDEMYFQHPHEFNPERFSPENKHKIPQGTYIPFGDGRRNCIGMRLGKFIILLALAGFLKWFRVVLSEKTVKELIFDPKKILGISVLGGIWVDIQRR